MPTLREIIDSRTIYAGIPPVPVNKGTTAGKSTGSTKGTPSAAATHVANHVADPVGATKEGFADLTQKKLAYDQSREEMQRQLAMPQAIINQVSQLHNINPQDPGAMPGMGMTPGMDPNNPGTSDDPDAMGQMPGQSPGQAPPGQAPPGAMGKGMVNTAPPQNMNQTTGKMNQSRPSLAGHQPGVAPGPAQSVVPGKMGMPKPGAPQFGKQAAAPKGSGKLPGAKGPGDPKVANKTAKAQNNSSRQIKVHVTASANLLPVIHASNTIETQFGLAALRQVTGIPVGTVLAGGPGSGRHKEILEQTNFDLIKVRSSNPESKPLTDRLINAMYKDHNPYGDEEKGN